MKYQLVLTILATSISTTAYSVDINQGSICRDKTCYEHQVIIDTQLFLSKPKWTDTSVSPPLSVSQASVIAKKYALNIFSKRPHQPKIEKIELRRYAFSNSQGENGPDFSDNWYYLVSFGLPIGADILPLNWVVILMDGSVVPPDVKRVK